MATHISGFNTGNKIKIDLKSIKVAFIVSEWNTDITDSLYSAALDTLLNYGIKRENISKYDVPGSFELTLGAQYLASKDEIDAVICIGCVIQGETKHFDFICQSISQGITNVSLKYDKPVIFGVLTPNNMQEAIDRSGGKYGNKGEEAAYAALKMIELSTIK